MFKLHVREFPDDCFIKNIDYLRLTDRVEQLQTLKTKKNKTKLSNGPAWKAVTIGK